MMLPKPPCPAPAWVALSVSPVSSKKNVWNLEPGWNCPFSGLLNGVPPAVFASALALNGVVVPDTAVSWIVNHVVSNVLP